MQTVMAPKLPRLAQRTTALTPGRMEKWLRLLGITNKQWRLWTNFQTYQAFIDVNPTCKLRQWQELVLENLDNIKTMK